MDYPHLEKLMKQLTPENREKLFDFISELVLEQASQELQARCI